MIDPHKSFTSLEALIPILIPPVYIDPQAPKHRETRRTKLQVHPRLYLVCFFNGRSSLSTKAVLSLETMSSFKTRESKAVHRFLRHNFLCVFWELSPYSVLEAICFSGNSQLKEWFKTPCPCDRVSNPLYFYNVHRVFPWPILKTVLVAKIDGHCAGETVITAHLEQSDMH